MSINSVSNNICRLLAAAIILQTLYFKFTAQAESVYIFTKLGSEPFGRISVGVIELATSILLIIPASSLYGAILGIMIMTGAILSHIFVLGIEIMDDGGKLFILAVFVWVSCLAVIFFCKNSLLRHLKIFIHDKKISH